MIARSRLVFSSVLVASSALHLGVVTLVWSEPAVEMAGGAPAAQSSLGSSFADLAAGVQQPINAVSAALQAVRPVTTSTMDPTVQATAGTPPVPAPQPVAPTAVSNKPPTTLSAAAARSQPDHCLRWQKLDLSHPKLLSHSYQMHLPPPPYRSGRRCRSIVQPPPRSNLLRNPAVAPEMLREMPGPGRKP